MLISLGYYTQFWVITVYYPYHLLPKGLSKVRLIDGSRSWWREICRQLPQIRGKTLHTVSWWFRNHAENTSWAHPIIYRVYLGFIYIPGGFLAGFLKHQQFFTSLLRYPKCFPYKHLLLKQMTLNSKINTVNTTVLSSTTIYMAPVWIMHTKGHTSSSSYLSGNHSWWGTTSSTTWGGIVVSELTQPPTFCPSTVFGIDPLLELEESLLS